MNKNARSWKPAIWSAVGLFVLHIFGTVLFASFGANVLQAMNLFGIFLGTLTLLAGIWLAFEKTAVKIVLTIAALFLTFVMPTAGFVLDSLFSTNWIAFTVNGIGIIFLCPIALMLAVHYWPIKKATATAEVKKEVLPLEPVPAPQLANAYMPAFIRYLERTNYKLELVLNGARLNDTSTPAIGFLWAEEEQAKALQTQIEERFAILFATFNQGKGLADNTDEVFPFMAEEEKIVE